MNGDEAKARRNRFVQFVSEHKSLIEQVINEPQEDKIPGVYLKKERSRTYWYARITVDAKRISLGRFPERVMAEEAVKTACDVYEIEMPKKVSKMKQGKRALITSCMNAGIYSHSNSPTVVYNGLIAMYNSIYQSKELEFKGKTYRERHSKKLSPVVFDFN